MFVEVYDANAICPSLLVHSDLYVDAVFGAISQDHIAFSPCTLQGATETQTKAVWVRQLREDCTRQHTCHNSRVAYFVACIGFRSCLGRCLLISSYPQVQSIRVDAFSFRCMISKQNTIRVMVVNGMFLLSSRIKILGKICDRQRFFLIDTFFVLFRSCLG